MRSSSQGIKYEPAPVKEILAKIKNLTTLMVDLAYASLLSKDASLAKEVLKLESEVDVLSYRLQMSLMLIARDAEDAASLQSILRAAVATDKMSDAVGDIAQMVLEGMEIHPIIPEALQELSEPIAFVPIAPGSPIGRKSLASLKAETKMGISILAIKRGDKLIVSPPLSDRISPGDVLIVRGARSGLEKLKKLSEEW